ncbi:hypothetical protein [Streptosporangium sp. NPDC087985]|uniref:hypothetical protein n=1 Tax=Streptosporangium sp. NPDC087985 TaxID=3366196 RepID=UPI0038265584
MVTPPSRARTAGRHRPGSGHAAVPQRSWDREARAEAARLDDVWPGWAVLYGTGSRLFYALATWPVPEPLIISDHHPEGLQEQMREAETAALTGNGHPAGAGQRGKRLPLGFSSLEMHNPNGS